MLEVHAILHRQRCYENMTEKTGTLSDAYQERIKKATKDTPKDILKLWEQELVDLELELNNMVDDEEDNNED